VTSYERATLVVGSALFARISKDAGWLMVRDGAKKRRLIMGSCAARR
jgi:uncharacterized iron-regulated membrane protein